MEGEENPMRRGRLLNGNRVGDPSTAPRCGAQTRAGQPCCGPAMPNGRCRMHGGTSTGPRTAAGLVRLRKARTRTGMHTAEMLKWRAEITHLRHLARQTRYRE